MHFSMIQSLKTSNENSQLIGLDHMRMKYFLTMD
jgi:hypothetical protein